MNHTNRAMKKRCKVCNKPGPIITSAPDGRQKFRCDRCGNDWTEGKPAGTGYKKWPTYKPKALPWTKKIGSTS